ncbi:unnamed protein product [Microthlaspi erraticum]|uniref:DUF4219 domain-containing protein n=1 Tax=Microthlaspi erraticum TaxID=1685480 RepID=A0A6D2JEH0_9BRAS|nr:unnamed protein product [Microthlaspi erraticum]CAA7055812.1 unnamed protein product [Microthlaspi erraticum]
MTFLPSLIFVAMEAGMQMQIPLFNGDDHEIWSTKMRTLLMARDLWDVVAIGVSEENTHQESDKKRQKDVRIKDMTALHMLQTSVTESIFYRIGRATSSKQAWEILKADYGETEAMQLRKSGLLVREYFDMKMKNEESFHEFSERFMKVVNRSKFYGSVVPDQTIIDKIRRSLTPWFCQTVFSRLSVEENYTLKEFVYTLREIEREQALRIPMENIGMLLKQQEREAIESFFYQ